MSSGKCEKITENESSTIFEDLALERVLTPGRKRIRRGGYLPGETGNAGGRPKDPFPEMIRGFTNGGKELMDFALAVLRDNLSGRVGAKAGVVESMLAEVAYMRKIAEQKGRGNSEEADALEFKAKSLATKLGRKRKIPVSVKDRMQALQWLTERGWGKVRDTPGEDITPSGPIDMERLDSDQLRTLASLVAGACRPALPGSNGTTGTLEEAPIGNVQDDVDDVE